MRLTDLIALDALRAPDILDVWQDVCAADVKPPEITLTLEDAADLLRTGTVFGYLDEREVLQGFIAAVPLELDGSPYAEIMIFFRSFAGRSQIATRGAREFVEQLVASQNRPIVTLVYEPNAKGKRFYTKIGFRFERNVKFSGHPFELWQAHGYGSE